MRAPAVLLGLVVGVPLSALCLWLALRGVDLDEVGSVLGDADPLLVGFAVAAMGAVYVGQGARWREVARTPDVSVPRFAEMVVSGVAVNNVVPGRVGDLLRARWLQVETRLPGGRALATVFVDRGFDVLALVVFVAVTLPLVASAEWLRRIALGGLVLLLGLVLVVAAARAYTGRRARARRVRRGRLRRILRDTLEGLSEPLGVGRTAALSGVSMVTWGMWAVAAWLVARALGIELSPVEAVFVTAVINLGVAIPSSPGFIGTYQWLGVSALGLIGIGSEQALAFSILMHATWYVPTLVVGSATLVRRGLAAMRRAGPVAAQIREVGDG